MGKAGGKAGRPRQFLELYEDLVAKCDSKETADAEYKTYMLLAKEQGLGKDARLGDIDVPSPGSKAKQVPRATKRSSEEVPHSRTKRQQVLDTSKHSAAAGISSSEKELYERLVEAERLRAEAEKQRGDDLSKIAMMLATGKGGAQLEAALKPKPAAAAAAAAAAADEAEEEDSKSPSRGATPEPIEQEEEEPAASQQQEGTQKTNTRQENRSGGRQRKHSGAGSSKSKGKSGL